MGIKPPTGYQAAAHQLERRQLVMSTLQSTRLGRFSCAVGKICRRWFARGKEVMPFLQYVFVRPRHC